MPSLSRITISSSKEDVFYAYGVPAEEFEVDDLFQDYRNYANRTLYTKGYRSKIWYRDLGIIFFVFDRWETSESHPLIKESYLPFIPKKWCGVLILAEAQNHSVHNHEYVEWLRSLNPVDRAKRLFLKSDQLGVYPWDDGSLKLAALSIFPGEKAERFAVGNAVMWSIRQENGSNANPTAEMIDKSIVFWKELLEVWRPNLIISAGKVAERVVKASWAGEALFLRLPAKTAMSRVSGMFDGKDLLKRYPEVAENLVKYPDLIRDGYRQNKIFFACHAVSIAKAKGVAKIVA